MIVVWEVDDGYVGSRPQKTTIPDEDLEDLTEEEREEYINDYIHEEFLQEITWYIKRIED